MTQEQLDEIEKRWAGYLEKDEGERRFLFDRWWDKRDFWDMTKALREAWARCETLRGLADEKAHDAGLYARRMGQAQKALREAAAKHNEALDMCQRYMGHLHKALEERDEARAEVERLKQLAREAIDFAVVLSGAAPDEYYWEYEAQLKALEAKKP